MGMLQLAQSCGFSVGILMWGCALTVYLPPHLVLGLCCGGWEAGGTRPAAPWAKVGGGESG